MIARFHLSQWSSFWGQLYTFRRWLAVGTMSQVQFEGTGYVLQSDVDAFVEACQCRNQKVYEPKRVQTVAS
jgi:hypothetical protein